VSEESIKAVLSVLGFARRAGALLIGQDIVKSSLARSDSLLVLLTETDSSFYRSLRKGRYAEKCLLFNPPGITEIDLSAAIGLRNVKVVALPLRGGFAQRILQLLAEGGEYIE
jgi:hypothetical protein